jgi:hypothetical protein
MSLRQAVAAPFRQRGVDRLRESEFVVVLSLDLEWFTAEQAQRLVDVAASEGLLAREDDAVVATFDPTAVDLPDDFVPDEAVLQQRSTFERTLAAIVEDGADKQTAVADINRLQGDLDVTVEAAAVLYARRRGLDVTGLAERAREEL